MRPEEYGESSKKRLLNNIKKKFDTTIIGSLAAFEDEFGYLWAHGKPYSELTEVEQEFRDMWNAARAKVLDNGNFNLRSAQSEISQYTISWNRYVTKFNFRKPGE
jgi:hypothetical protein